MNAGRIASRDLNTHERGLLRLFSSHLERSVSLSIADEITRLSRAIFLRRTLHFRRVQTLRDREDTIYFRKLGCNLPYIPHEIR